METLERHLLNEIINGYQIDLKEEELKQFSLQFHKQYNLIKRMRTQGIEITPTEIEVYALMVNEKLDKGYALKDDKLSTQNIEDVIKLRLSLAKNDLRVDKMANLLSEFRDGSQNAGLELQKILSTTLRTNKKSSVVGIKEYYKEQMDFFRKIVDGEELDGLILWGNGKKKTSQFRGLSNIIKRIAPSDLVLIGARPSVGKTSFALALMNALYKHDYKPLFISLEMTNGELLQRLATAKSGLSYDLMMSSETKLDKEKQHAYHSGLFEASEMDIKLINNPPSSWLEMKRMILEHKDIIDYVVIDHMHIISTYDGEQSNNKNQMYGEISRDMKMLARDYGIPIIVLAQLSREVRSGGNSRGGKRTDPSYVEPFSTDLRDSGSLEQDADKVFMLYREHPDKQEDHQQYGVFPIVCKVEKNRSGKLGKIRYNFYAKTGRWKEVYN